MQSVVSALQSILLSNFKTAWKKNSVKETNVHANFARGSTELPERGSTEQSESKVANAVKAVVEAENETSVENSSVLSLCCALYPGSIEEYCRHLSTSPFAAVEAEGTHIAKKSTKTGRGIEQNMRGRSYSDPWSRDLLSISHLRVITPMVFAIRDGQVAFIKCFQVLS